MLDLFKAVLCGKQIGKSQKFAPQFSGLYQEVIETMLILPGFNTRLRRMIIHLISFTLAHISAIFGVIACLRSTHTISIQLRIEPNDNIERAMVLGGG
jgi:hypothetical protein